MKQWLDWAAAAQKKDKNLKINIYQISKDTPGTVDAFLGSLKAKDTATIFMGHSYHSKNQMGILMSGRTIGNSQNQKEGKVSHTADGIDIQNTVVAIFSCGFGKGFNNLTSTTGAAFVSIVQGQEVGDHKTTFAPATNAAAFTFAKNVAEGTWNSLLSQGDLNLATARSQSGIAVNQHPTIPEVNRGDGVVYRILPPPRKK